ncbi:zinc metallochaperone AztD [Corynebacterium alimapuense]|uniref:Secreted protein n=1 Tax=Corynebacterium alimapuense TaxID=1576874 RepID=A0A3M8KA24_9CORY|nr:zinc metallochaperone AztD [Corynebacterium alimapuense]RNE49308.1 hypothetical protein C5L39_02775 [Corynebacterium alimapuense]
MLSFSKSLAVPAVVASTAILFAGCTSAETEESPSTTTSPAAAEESHEGHDHGEEQEEAVEVSAAQPRIVATYDGGLLTLDAETLEVVSETPIDGFARVNNVGDGRHVMVSANGEFQLFDAGVWSEPHGDHSHSFAGTPELTDTVFEGDTPGHVVNHAGKTLLYSDGDGKIQILDTSSTLTEDTLEPEIHYTLEPHHGIAVELSNGELVHTLGNSEERVGVIAFDSEGEEIARSEQCPGVHGESAIEGEVLSFGCEDGMLTYEDGQFEKIDSPDEYGRIGSQAGSEVSSVVLGDYKVDPDADNEQPERVSLTNTETGNIQLVDLGTSYTFRSLGRGPVGEALVLGTDGNLHVIDPDSGEITNSIPVVEAWEAPVEWQDARPTLHVIGDLAYVSDPATNELHVVDLTTGEEITSSQLPETINEIASVSG